MRKLFGRLLGMLSALVIWQAIMAFIGAGLFVSGVAAGYSLLAFGTALIIIAGILVRPKEREDER